MTGCFWTLCNNSCFASFGTDLPIWIINGKQRPHYLLTLAAADCLATVADSVCTTCHCAIAGPTSGSRQAQTSHQISTRPLACSMMRNYDHLSKIRHCSITDKQPATCPHCSSQFINQSVLEIHLQRCPTTEEEKNTGRGRGQGRGRCTGQVGDIKKFFKERMWARVWFVFSNRIADGVSEGVAMCLTVHIWSWIVTLYFK